MDISELVNSPIFEHLGDISVQMETLLEFAAEQKAQIKLTLHSVDILDRPLCSYICCK